MRASRQAAGRQGATAQPVEYPTGVKEKNPKIDGQATADNESKARKWMNESKMRQARKLPSLRCAAQREFSGENDAASRIRRAKVWWLATKSPSRT